MIALGSACWIVLGALALVLAVGLVRARREDLARMAETAALRERVARAGGSQAQLQHPVIDLSRCLGCGTCIEACPEDGVLELVHGQAVVVRGARCVGVAACERECPVGAITVTMANLAERDDVPAVDDDLEAVGCPGLFLAGEVTARALIKTAVEHGTRAVREIALRVAGGAPGGELDLVVVGAGPAGLAASLEARRIGLRFVTLEQELGPGGTVAKYPRAKLVVNEPVQLPLFGRLPRNAYLKEDLVALWGRLAAEHELPIRYGERFERLERDPASGGFVVWTPNGSYSAKHVLMAIGRRGSPRKLGVPGEELEKVTYSLLDASAHRGKRVLVVGGGDAAVEAALGLAEQEDNHVTLSYRRDEFIRVRARNAERLTEAVDSGAIEVIVESEVVSIDPDAVELRVAKGGAAETLRVSNDEVLVLIGGDPPVEMLERAGVSFDPSDRPPARPVAEQGNGLVRALAAGLAMTVAALGFLAYHRSYYLAGAAERATHAQHDLLRSGRGLGLAFGIAGLAFVAVNLAYLARRSPRFSFAFGSLRAWMTVHVASGVLAFLLCALHACMTPRGSVGGYALGALALLLLTGAVGRYFYAAVPRAANGRELELEEVRRRLSDDVEAGGDPFAREARAEVLALVDRRLWGVSLLSRIGALFGVRADIARALARIERRGLAESVSPERVDAALHVARRAHRLALEAAHIEDLRALMSGWRWLHRWVTVLMLVLVAVHVVHAVLYADLLGPRSGAVHGLRAPLGGGR